MKVAIDKNKINEIKNFKEFDYVYLFEEEKYEDLKKLNIHCLHKDYAEDIDLNLTKYNIPCLKKASIKDKAWKKPIKKKNYKFAIIVPNCNNDRGNYQGKTYLQNCIESILNQTYKNFELIIVDDMSTDTSVETVDNYVDNRIHLIKNKRKRYNGGSRNVGIEYALDNFEFDYFCFLDSDDWWKHNKVLEHINRKLYNHDLMILGAEMLFPDGNTLAAYNKYDTYEDIYFCINKVWCTCWSKVIRKDKIVYFCEDTLMEDRVWSYKLADNVDFDKIVNINEICYVWNRLNTDNSVSIVGGNIWEASAWCHIGHQLQFLTKMKHQEMKPKLQERINTCINKVNRKEYQQY